MLGQVNQMKSISFIELWYGLRDLLGPPAGAKRSAMLDFHMVVNCLC